MWRHKSVSVVFGTYREKDSIRAAIEDFFASGCVDEVVVVNNNAEPGTDEEVRKTKARLVHEPRQGYGYSFQRGIEEAKGDYIVLAEPDGTFRGADIERFLVYANDFPAVFGTRTNQSSILEGAAMGLVRKLANVVEGKVIEVLFATNSVTDVGCTYKLFERRALEHLRPLWRERGALFATELLLLTIAGRTPFVEIPITFRARVGTSSLTANSLHAMAWGVRILWFILRFWLRWLCGRIPAAPREKRAR